VIEGARRFGHDDLHRGRFGEAAEALGGLGRAQNEAHLLLAHPRGVDLPLQNPERFLALGQHLALHPVVLPQTAQLAGQQQGLNPQRCEDNADQQQNPDHHRARRRPTECPSGQEVVPHLLADVGRVELDLVHGWCRLFPMKGLRGVRALTSASGFTPSFSQHVNCSTQTSIPEAAYLTSSLLLRPRNGSWRQT
jgi:hypothetical protein